MYMQRNSDIRTCRKKIWNYRIFQVEIFEQTIFIILK